MKLIKIGDWSWEFYTLYFIILIFTRIIFGLPGFLFMAKRYNKTYKTKQEVKKKNNSRTTFLLSWSFSSELIRTPTHTTKATGKIIAPKSGSPRFASPPFRHCVQKLRRWQAFPYRGKHPPKLSGAVKLKLTQISHWLLDLRYPLLRARINPAFGVNAVWRYAAG